MFARGTNRLADDWSEQASSPSSTVEPSNEERKSIDSSRSMPPAPASASSMATPLRSLPLVPLKTGANNANTNSANTNNANTRISQSASSASNLDASNLEIADKRWLSPPLPLEDRATLFSTLREQIVLCRKCDELACSRKQTVFGSGSLSPRVVFFGEAPGADEDRIGEPFVGAAGQLLNKIISASQMNREEVYILNSLKCRPPGNRTPVDLEIENCRPYFESQLDVLQPEFIVCLGAVAVRAVLQTTESVGRLRGRFHRYRKAQVLVTYHPAYLLRNESAKKYVWDDMKLLMTAMGLKLPNTH